MHMSILGLVVCSFVLEAPPFMFAVIDCRINLQSACIYLALIDLPP